MTKLWDRQKDFTHQPSQWISTWLLQCWEHKSELFTAQWAYVTSGHPGRCNVHCTRYSRTWNMHHNEVSHVSKAPLVWRTLAATPVREATLPQTRQGKHYPITVVEGTTGWLEMQLEAQATAWKPTLGLEKQFCGNVAPWKNGVWRRDSFQRQSH